jgi:2-oxoglutarate dehydrogenase complex dehydrogenase (E1) component-like enzyme
LKYFCRPVPELEAVRYGISADSHEIIQTDGIFHGPDMPVEELIKNLEAIYCGPAAIEFQHLEVDHFDILRVNFIEIT